MRISSDAPWYALLGAVVLVPLTVGAIPVSGAPLTLNVFVVAKVVVLCLTVGAALGLWALVDLRDGTIRTGRALVPLGIFVLVAVVSTVLAVDRRIAFFGDFEQGVGLLVILLVALTCFLVAQMVRDQSRLDALTSVVILTATAVAVVGLMQQTFHVDLTGIYSRELPDWIIRRGYGTIGNPDTYAAYLVLPALLAFDRLRRATDSSSRIRWGGCTLAISASLLIAQTRGPLAGLAVGAAAYAWMQARLSRAARSRPDAKQKSKTTSKAKSKAATSAPARGSSLYLVPIVAAAAVVSVLAIWYFGDLPDFLTRFGTVQSLAALGDRIPLWSAAWRIAAAHPLFGVGPDSFRLGWYPLRDASHLARGAGLVITDPHSAALLIAATMGVAGLASAAFLGIAALVEGYGTFSGGMAAGRRGSDHEAWLAGTLALLLTLVTSMVASVLVFVLFVAFGVLMAPTLEKRDVLPGPAVTGKILRTVSLITACAVLAFGLVTATAQLMAVGTRTDDLDLAAAGTARAASVAPWDSELLMLRYRTMVQAAVEHAFTGAPDAAAAVSSAEGALSSAGAAEPRDYFYPYQSTLLLIGAGQKLGPAYVSRGISAGERGLAIYPQSLELRTGMATGYLQLGKPKDAAALLRTVWDADPGYAASGVTYAKALIALGMGRDAREVVSVLKTRFPTDASVSDLVKQTASS